jgi:hypothetical protein
VIPCLGATICTASRDPEKQRRQRRFLLGFSSLALPTGRATKTAPQATRDKSPYQQKSGGGYSVDWKTLAISRLTWQHNAPPTARQEAPCKRKRAIISGFEIFRGLPNLFPFARAFRRPARTLSAMRLRSSSATARTTAGSLILFYFKEAFSWCMGRPVPERQQPCFGLLGLSRREFRSLEKRHASGSACIWIMKTQRVS